MGKVAGATETKGKKKKKGRPSLSDLRNRNSDATKRNPNAAVTESDSDDDERKQKKVKLVLNEIHRSAPAALNDDVVVKAEKATEALQGSVLEFGPTTPLPDKKLLVFILDRLQKKDTYGVFSEPVDPDELPDYFEIIEHPMDFGTVRKKLDEGSYSNLDDFEADVLLICANGMQFNAPDTVYFRQAKSIQDIAKRDFENLRQVNEEGVPQPKVVKRGRPPNSKKALCSPPLDRVGPESSSDATLATAGDNDNNNDSKNNIINDSNAAGSNSYNLRKGLASFRVQSSDALYKASPQSRNNETYADYTTDWNSEFPASVLKAEAKHTKKQFLPDENRRTTYKQFHPSAAGRDPSLTTLNGNMKHLIGVGLHTEHGYARSLARFAANLGPVIWKIASKKIESVLPSGVNFGPGWVGENDSLPPQNNVVHDNDGSHLQADEEPEQTSNEHSVLKNNISRMGSKHLVDNRNGLNHLSEYDFPTQAEMLRARLNLPTGQKIGSLDESHPTPTNHSTPPLPNMDVSSSKSPHNISANNSSNIIPVPPDLNVRFQSPGSPNSSFRIGSPQPDLVLQL